MKNTYLAFFFKYLNYLKIYSKPEKTKKYIMTKIQKKNVKNI